MSDFEIRVMPGKPVTLLTAGKYCDRNIIVSVPLTIITPKIGFNQGKLYAPATSASFTPVSYTDYDITFQYRGGSGCEELMFPITGLSKGATYTLSFEETYNGSYIGSEYVYGCGILQKSTHDSINFPSGAAKPSWVQWSTDSTGTQKGKISFTAQDSTVYWGWALSRIKDGVIHTMSIKVDVYAA